MVKSSHNPTKEQKILAFASEIPEQIKELKALEKQNQEIYRKIKILAKSIMDTI